MKVRVQRWNAGEGFPHVFDIEVQSVPNKGEFIIYGGRTYEVTFVSHHILETPDNFRGLGMIVVDAVDRGDDNYTNAMLRG